MKTQKLFQVFSVALLIGGCIGPREITVDPEELNILKTEPEIRAVHYLPWASLTVLQELPNFSYYLNRGPWRKAKFPVEFEDPISKIQDRFVAGLTKELNLHNVRSIGEARPPSGDLYSPLKRTFGSGMVFDFETRYWRLYSSIYRNEKTNFMLTYAVRGRLIRVDDSNLLWKAICNVDLPFETSLDTKMFDLSTGQDYESILILILKRLLAEEGSVLKLKRDEAETRCSSELLKKFLGK